MGLHWIACFLFFLTPLASLAAASPSLYFIQTGRVKEGVDQYLADYKKTGTHDFDLLQQMGLALLELGYRDREITTQVMSLYGAALANHDCAIPILERGLSHSMPEVQLLSIQLLSQFNHSEATQAFYQAMRSNFYEIRLEAAYQLAQRKDPRAFGQIESLMSKTPKELLPLMASLFATEGSPGAIRQLHKLIAHPYIGARSSAIAYAAERQYDELLPPIRMAVKHSNLTLQEVGAYAIGQFRDQTSLPHLETLAKSTAPHVKLAALVALYKMGKEEAANSIISMGRDGNLFAISEMGYLEKAKEALLELVDSKDLLIKINAALSLLEMREAKSLEGLKHILARDIRDLAFTKQTSPGGTSSYWKLLPASQNRLQQNLVPLEMSLKFREGILVKTIDLPPDAFITLATFLIETRQDELVPILAGLLENQKSPEAIALLKKGHSLAGAPLIRQYCTLALYRMGEEGPYEQQLMEWIGSKQTHSIINLRPPVPASERGLSEKFQINPDETSQLLISTLIAFASKRNKQSIELLLQVIRDGDNANRHVLAGLLIQAVQ